MERMEELEDGEELWKMTRHDRGYLHKTKAVETPAGMGQGMLRVHPWWRNYGQLMSTQGRRVALL